MPVAIPNFRYTYLRKGKPVFVPSTVGRRIGEEVKERVAGSYAFDERYYHLRKGGHIAAMHLHRPHSFFARIDISRFFYSVSRRRVQSALERIGLDNVAFLAKWSTVRNPYEEPKFALPYGFVQSPILASLTLALSEAGRTLSLLPQTISASVYMDDISLSSDDLASLEVAFREMIAALERDGFSISEKKLRPPSEQVDLFNCDLSRGRASVRSERIEAFFADSPTMRAENAFIAYCASVEVGNAL